MATRNLDFILSNMLIEGRLMRSWRDGAVTQVAFLEDYAALILALLAHYQTNPDPKWFQAALDLNETMLSLFPGDNALFFDTPQDHEQLLYRPRDIQDNATPAGNSLAAHALLQLAAYQGDVELGLKAEQMLGGVQAYAVQHPTAFSNWLCALDFALQDVREVAIISPLDDSRLDHLTAALWSEYRPNLVAAIAPPSANDTVPALLNQRPLVNKAPTAYVCQDFVCKQPINDAETFRQLLKNPGSLDSQA